MRLKELGEFQTITIQCHDNPDGDAIASAYALYEYFKSKGKDVSIIYGGVNKIQKVNLLLMVEMLNVPIIHVEKNHVVKGLLITVDCQYGAGNVTKFEADSIAIIDHHQIEITNIEQSEIRSELGSCATLVWNMMRNEGYNFENNIMISTALYYGLFTDTNQFSEIGNPLDMDMLEELKFKESIIRKLKNSNLSIEELEIAGTALGSYIFNEDYNYAIVKSEPCDPNILGLISDFLLQVHMIDYCIVYNELEFGYKLSVRSDLKEVRANELAQYLTEGLGSGGGHFEKAGGFISKEKYQKTNRNLPPEVYFSQKMNEYFESIDIIYANETCMNIESMQLFKKKKIEIGYVKTVDIAPAGTNLIVRTLEGDINLLSDESIYIMIGIKGEVYPIVKNKFENSYHCLDNDFRVQAEYIPTVKNQELGINTPILPYARTCVATSDSFIYARPLEKAVKIFTLWDEEKYLLGKKGDYIGVRSDDHHDIYAIDRDIFIKTYELYEEVE